MCIYIYVCVCVCVWVGGCVIKRVDSCICAHKSRVQLWLNLKSPVFLLYITNLVYFPRTENVICLNYWKFLQFRPCIPNDGRNFAESCTTWRWFSLNFAIIAYLFFRTEKFWLTCKPFELSSRQFARKPGFYPRFNHVGFMVDKGFCSFGVVLSVFSISAP